MPQYGGNVEPIYELYNYDAAGFHGQRYFNCTVPGFECWLEDSTDRPIAINVEPGPRKVELQESSM